MCSAKSSESICNAIAQCLLESLLNYPLLLGDSTPTPVLIVNALYLAHIAKQKSTPLRTIEVLLGR